ncbi:MAG: hypothetical protein HYX69_06050 [Planctomycetia bacterium]|nr:hypothetical protein [Planctomycetia bacterium]
MNRHPISIACVLLLFAAVPSRAVTDEPAPPKSFVVGDAYKLIPPAGWAVKQPRSRIVEHEFAVPAAKGDELEGRVTVMGAGGSVEANIDRWYQQFTQPDGGNTKERAKVEKKTIAGQEVTSVDIAGTFMDRAGPQAPAVERKNYRMLGAIIQTKQAGNYFIKFYGPQRTVAENKAAFDKMLDSLERK